MEERVVQLIQEANRLNNELTAVLIQLSRYIKEEEDWTDEERGVRFLAKMMFGIEPDLESIRKAKPKHLR